MQGAVWGAAGLVLSWMLGAGMAGAQSFNMLRYDDDFAAQRAACTPSSPLACWKDRPVADDVRISLGGNARWRYEFTGNPAYGEDPQDRWGALLQRYTLFADVRVGQQWHAFAQMSTSLANGRREGPSPVDENRLDPSNLFLEWQAPTPNGQQVGVRAGIQELRLGSSRLIDARDGTNVRRTFDAVRGYVTSGPWRMDAFVAAPRLNRPGSLDDARSRTQALRGLYVTRANEAGQGWDTYLLHYEDKAARYARGSAHERRWTLGTRVFGKQGNWDWNWEVAGQAGRFGDDGIRAWTVATETGYRYADVAWQPRVALLAAAASGDRGGENKRLGTFNPMYPRGNYFGEEATLGPRNFFNLQPTLTVQPLPQVELTASLSAFWRASAQDGVYAPSGALMRAPGDSRARYVATVASFGATWQPAPGWSTSLVLANLWPGRFLQETGMHEPLRYVELTALYSF